MSDDELPELDDELRALLAAEADAPDPPAGALERVLERVQRTIIDTPPDPGTEPGGEASSGGSPTAPASASTPAPVSGSTPVSADPGNVAGLTGAAAPSGALSLPLVAALSFVLGAGAGVVGARLASPVVEAPVPERVVERVVEVPVRVVETVYLTAEPEGARADAGPRAEAGGATESTGATSGAAGESPSAGESDAEAGAASGRDRELADENALVSRAQAALARGRTAEALAATAEHQRLFPRGEFVEEREALAIQALARSGRLDAARTRAERFRVRYPRSMLLRAVEAAVAERSAP